jgi:hypothetical protein
MRRVRVTHPTPKGLVFRIIVSPAQEPRDWKKERNELGKYFCWEDSKQQLQ